MIVVESVATTAMGGGNTVPKPTGLTEGDLMIAVVAGNAAITNPSGWTSLFNSSDADAYSYCRATAKVADSGDVAASNFTFVNANGGIIYRLSGAAAIAEIETGTGTVVGQDNHIILFAYGGDNGSLTTTYSGYSVTGGVAVSFTERYDDSEDLALTTNLGVADGQYASNANITTFSVTRDSALDNHQEVLLAVAAAQDANPDISHLAITPTVENVTGSHTANADISHLAITPSIENITAKSSSDRTQWTNEIKPTTTWTNEQKL